MPRRVGVSRAGVKGETHMSATKFPWSGLALAALLGLGECGRCRRCRRDPGRHRSRLRCPIPAHRSALQGHPRPPRARLPGDPDRRQAGRGDAGARLRGDRRVGKTGVVAIYKNGAGPTVMVRTELDALPMEEKTGLPYASTAKADVAMAARRLSPTAAATTSTWPAWVGTRRDPARPKDQWNGTLMFVAQPAEEGAAAPRHAGRRPVHALRQARLRLRAARRPGPMARAYRPGVINSTSDGL